MLNIFGPELFPLKRNPKLKERDEYLRNNLGICPPSLPKGERSALSSR